MNRTCSICGSSQAIILCARCGQIVCENCYDSLKKECIRCSTVRESQGKKKMNINLRIIGIIFMIIGIFLTTITNCIFVEGESNTPCKLYSNVIPISLPLILLSIHLFNVFHAPHTPSNRQKDAQVECYSLKNDAGRETYIITIELDESLIVSTY